MYIYIYNYTYVYIYECLSFSDINWYVTIVSHSFATAMPPPTSLAKCRQNAWDTPEADARSSEEVPLCRPTKGRDVCGEVEVQDLQYQIVSLGTA